MTETRQRGHMSAAPMPVEELRSLLRYDAETGHLHWRNGRQGRRTNGIAGTKISNGYINIMIDGRRYQAHGLIWFLVTGDWLMVDHEDGDGGNNHWPNLRPATKQQNGWNVRGRGESGFKGVYRTASGKWAAQIKVGDKHLHFPSRDTPEEAFADYCAAAQVHHGQFARLS